jgi:hypothetical protein
MGRTTGLDSGGGDDPFDGDVVALSPRVRLCEDSGERVDISRPLTEVSSDSTSLQDQPSEYTQKNAEVTPHHNRPAKCHLQTDMGYELRKKA